MRVTNETRVFIKNFGDGNYLWPEALSRSSICLITDNVSHDLYKQQSEEAYRRYAISQLKTSRLLPPTEGTVSLWWNTHERFDAATPADIFIHDDGRHLYWSQLKSVEPKYITRDDPYPRGREGAKVTVTFREVHSWNKYNLKDLELSIDTLHPQAIKIIRTRMTLAEAKPENAAYIISLIRGDDLNHWHSQPRWTRVLDQSKKAVGRGIDLWEKAAFDIVYDTKRTSAAGGTIYLANKKEKPLGFSDDEEFRHYILELHSAQDGICALTGLSYMPRSKEFRGDLMMSLDRIDSSLGYIRGNLQLTCWFANRWKGSDENSVFLELIDKVRDINRDND